jgi:hypothetical protein
VFVTETGAPKVDMTTEHILQYYRCPENLVWFTTTAHFGDRDHVDRFIVISVIGDHDRSGATLGAGG